MSDIIKVHPFKDRDNPTSLVNICHGVLGRAIENLPEAYLDMGEKELKRTDGLTEIDEMLRIAFWREYDQSLAQRRKFGTNHVYSGTCTNTHFFKNILNNPIRLAYMLQPPREYEVRMTYLLDYATDQILEILNLPNTKKNGEGDGMIAGVKHKIWETLLDRVRGSVVSKSESRVLQANVDASDFKPVDVDQLSLDQINERLEQLESIQASSSPQIESSSEQVIDVETDPPTTEG